MSDVQPTTAVVYGVLHEGRLDPEALHREAARDPADWLLALDPGDRLPDHAPRDLAAFIQREGAGFDALALPCIQYIGAEPLRFAPVYPGYEVRVIRRDRIDALVGGRLQVLPVPVEQAPHVHRKPYPNLAAWVDAQRRGLQTRQQSPEAQSDSLEEHLARAYNLYAVVAGPGGGSDLQQAAAKALASLEILAGLEAWDARGRREDVSAMFALPVRIVVPEGLHAKAWQEMRREVVRLNQAAEQHRAVARKLHLVQAELDATRATVVWRAYQAFEITFPGVIRALKRITGRS